VDAYTTALTWLSRRELSAAQVRIRLERRKFSAAEIDAALTRLAAERVLDDRRVALAAARREGVVRVRGRRRALQRLQQLGVSATVAKDAVDEVFAEIDESAQLQRAIDKKLRGADPRALDDKAKARLVRSLLRQGFEADSIYQRVGRSRVTPQSEE
jgi:regulatory protein